MVGVVSNELKPLELLLGLGLLEEGRPRQGDSLPGEDASLPIKRYRGVHLFQKTDSSGRSMTDGPTATKAFTEVTAAALSRFQLDRALPITRTLDPVTLTALKQAHASQPREAWLQPRVSELGDRRAFASAFYGPQGPALLERLCVLGWFSPTRREIA